MGLSDILDSFDATKYRDRLLEESNRPNGKQLICEREIAKRRQIYGNGAKIVGCAALGAWTGGVAFVGCALGARQCSIAEQKLAVIQKIMNEKGWPLYTETKRDFFIPVAATMVGLGVGGAVGGGMTHVASLGTQMAVSHGAHEAAHYTTAQTISQVAAHPIGFVEGAGHGLKMGLEQLHSVIQPGDLATNAAVATISNGVPIDSGIAKVAGMTIGHTAAMAGVHQAASYAASTTVKYKGDDFVESQERNSTFRKSQQADGTSVFEEVTDWQEIFASLEKEEAKKERELQENLRKQREEEEAKGEQEWWENWQKREKEEEAKREQEWWENWQKREKEEEARKEQEWWEDWQKHQKEEEERKEQKFWGDWWREEEIINTQSNTQETGRWWDETAPIRETRDVRRPDWW